jgi:hypothetical protein
LSEGKPCQIATNPGSGRVLAVVAFVKILIDAFLRPILIVVNDDHSTWVRAVKLIGGLISTEDNGTDPDRLLMQYQEFVKPIFDRAITTLEVYESDFDFLRQQNWTMIVFDRLSNYHNSLVLFMFIFLIHPSIV